MRFHTQVHVSHCYYQPHAMQFAGASCMLTEAYIILLRVVCKSTQLFHIPNRRTKGCKMDCFYYYLHLKNTHTNTIEVLSYMCMFRVTEYATATQTTCKKCVAFFFIW